jgi:hypothetical protein
MTLSRALPLLLALAAVLPMPAAAQFGGTPGTPGAPPMPPFGAAPAGPPPACQQLLSLRDEVQKHAQTLQAAGQKKVKPTELCKLFEAYLGAESKMVKALEESYATCGLPRDVAERVKVSHAKAEQMGKNVCEMAAQGPRSLQIDWLTPPGRPQRFDAPAPECTEKTRWLGIPCVD